jgi:hypothetical protein
MHTDSINLLIRVIRVDPRLKTMKQGLVDARRSAIDNQRHETPP